MTHLRSFRRLSLVFLALAMLIPACKKRKTDTDVPDERNRGAPSSPNSGGNPQAKKAPSPWADTAIAFTHRDGVTFGPPGCPVLVVGTLVYDARTYKAVRQLPDPYERQALCALSPDGKSFVAANKSPNQDATGFTVWSTENAGRLLDVAGKKDTYLDVLAFRGNSQLLVGGRHNGTIDVWDIPSKKSIGQLTVPDKEVHAAKLAFSPDGKTFAGTAHDKLVITDIATNKPVATMASPGDKIGEAGKLNDTGAIFVYAWTHALAFSPDGSELALFTSHPSPRLIVWSSTGQMLMDQSVPMPQFVSHKNALEWMPDGKGFLINGYVIDRETRRPLVNVRVPFASDILPHFLDKDRIICNYGDSGEELQTITIPWDKIYSSVKQLNDRATAYLTPGMSVRLAFDLKGLRGDEAQTRQMLAAAITQRLARDGITVAAEAPTVFWMRLTEEAGETLPIYQRQSPFDRRGADTGKKATEAKGAAILEIWSQGEKEPLWRGRLKAESGRGSFIDEINDASLRKDMLQVLSQQLGSMDLPYFLPKSKDVVALPAVIE